MLCPRKSTIHLRSCFRLNGEIKYTHSELVERVPGTSYQKLCNSSTLTGMRSESPRHPKKKKQNINEEVHQLNKIELPENGLDIEKSNHK